MPRESTSIYTESSFPVSVLHYCLMVDNTTDVIYRIANFVSVLLEMGYLES